MKIKILLSLFLLTIGFNTSASFNNSGMITKKCSHSVENVVSKLENIFQKKGIKLIAKVDHQENANDVELNLKKLTLLIFGNPKLGTHLMTSQPSAGLDLPMKALVYEDKDGSVNLTYNDANYIAQRHNINNRSDIIKKMSGALMKITDQACTKK